MDNRSDVRITLSENGFRCLSSHVEQYLRQNHLSPQQHSKAYGYMSSDKGCHLFRVESYPMA